jgi:purine-nucleoside phosphorylase
MRDEGALASDAATLTSAAGGALDVAIVLGSGLSDALAAHATFASIPYERLPSLPAVQLAGHAGAALVASMHGHRVLAFAGRVHLYQGFSATEVTASVRLAHAAGAKTLVLTNAAGALNAAFEAGQLMILTDHLNLTGVNPLVGSGLDDPFVDMVGAYDPQLRDIALDAALDDLQVREGVYAGLLGPSYETPAESAYLRTIGADAVGMSTVLETIVARSLGMRVLGISLITNEAGGGETTHDQVMAVAAQAAARLAAIIDNVIAKL